MGKVVELIRVAAFEKSAVSFVFAFIFQESSDFLNTTSESDQLSLCRVMIVLFVDFL